MAVRAVNNCTILRSTSSPRLHASRCHLRVFQSLRRAELSSRFRTSRSGECFRGDYAGVRSCSVRSFVNNLMNEVKASRRRKRTSVSCKMGVAVSGEIFEDKLEKRPLQKGVLLEFKQDSERILLAVAQKPDGKKNWTVFDQNGVLSSIKPQKITYIVPGVGNFGHAEISDFIKRAQDNLDCSLVEVAWSELIGKDKYVKTEEFAEMIFGSAEPLESYCAHVLLSRDEIYFTVVEKEGSASVYAPRPSVQVEELIQRKLAKEAADRELQEFVELMSSAKAMSQHEKPPKASWKVESKTQSKVESLEAYAIDACDDEQKRMAGMILKAMGLAKTASSAVNLLIDVGYFPVHVNLDLLKINIPTDYSDEIISAAGSLLLESYDLDEDGRKDLTHLKVYVIDVDEADELDDALSATRLQDGRIKVWIHVADPTSLILPGSIIEREAMKRGASVFLPSTTYPMFPEKLAMEGMSLKQGKLCNAVTVSVVLHSDGSIAEYTVDNSVIKPTYMLTYESASELLHLNLEEEVELRILSEAATHRLQWRRQQGAVDTATLDTRIKVTNPDDPQPAINLFVENQANPAMRLVSEMMILCGEAIARFGSCNNLSLPYRGQPQANFDTSAFAHLPEGPVRSYALAKVMQAAEMDFRKPIQHGILGVPGYVQFTSPIRRYMDLLAHYQVKAFLRGDSPPFSAGQLEGMASIVNMNVKIAKRLSNSSLRYWMLEHLRRQPKEQRFCALILRFIKDRMATLLLLEVGFQASALVSVGNHVGDVVEVRVEEAHPRDGVLSLREVI